MNHYSDFSAEDLVWDDFFRQWILSPTSENNALWDNWLRANPGMYPKVEQARAIVLTMQLQEPDIDDAEIRDLVKQTIGRISDAESEDTQPVRRLFATAWTRFAASIALITVLGWAAYTFLTRENNTPGIAQTDSFIQQSDSFVDQTNTSTRTIELALSDGSRISLAPGAKVRYPRQFDGERREVYLEGEAFFDIAKDSEHPFLVFANGLITKVLGTSFRIKSHGKGGEVTVEVKTGKVSVFAQSDPQVKEKLENAALQGVVLKPNQKVIYARNEVKMVKTLVEKPEIVVAKADIPQFDFEDTPASDVFNTLGKAYGIDIIYDAALLKDCPLTALLEGLTLHDQLNIICKAVESSYEIVDGQVIVHSTGCKN